MIVHIFDILVGNVRKSALHKRIVKAWKGCAQRLFSETDLDISQSSNVSSQELADTSSGKTSSLDVERINVMKRRRVMADEMPIYDSYFSFLQLKKFH